MSKKPDYQKLYEIAEGQAGYFTARQARTIGFSWERLSNNVKSGRFRRVAHGVYRLVQFPNTAFEDFFVGWLRAGPEAVISHESALAIYELSDIMPSEVHLIVPRTSSSRRKGIRQHTMQLGSDEITHREGLPVTTVPRTLADVAAAGLAEDQIRLAIQQALQRGLVTEVEMQTYAERRGGRFKKIINEQFNKDGLI